MGTNWGNLGTIWGNLGTIWGNLGLIGATWGLFVENRGFLKLAIAICSKLIIIINNYHQQCIRADVSIRFIETPVISLQFCSMSRIVPNSKSFNASFATIVDCSLKSLHAKCIRQCCVQYYCTKNCHNLSNLGAKSKAALEPGSRIRQFFLGIIIVRTSSVPSRVRYQNPNQFA